MIPAWLTPQIARLAGILSICCVLFAGGCITRGKFDAGTIERLKAENATITQNYEYSLRTIDRCMQNVATLEDALRQQGEAIRQMGEDSRKAIEEANRMREEALARERELHEQALATMQSEYARLYQEWASLSAADACHQAWLEVTDVQ